MGSLFIDTLPSGMALCPLTGMVLGYTGLVPHELKKNYVHTSTCVYSLVYAQVVTGRIYMEQTKSIRRVIKLGLPDQGCKEDYDL